MNPLSTTFKIDQTGNLLPPARRAKSANLEEAVSSEREDRLQQTHFEMATELMGETHRSASEVASVAGSQRLPSFFYGYFGRKLKGRDVGPKPGHVITVAEENNHKWNSELIFCPGNNNLGGRSRAIPLQGVTKFKLQTFELKENSSGRLEKASVSELTYTATPEKATYSKATSGVVFPVSDNPKTLTIDFERREAVLTLTPGYYLSEEHRLYK